jgi:hypothetical protein
MCPRNAGPLQEPMGANPDNRLGPVKEPERGLPRLGFRWEWAVREDASQPRGSRERHWQRHARRTSDKSRREFRLLGALEIWSAFVSGATLCVSSPGLARAGTTRA